MFKNFAINLIEGDGCKLVSLVAESRVDIVDHRVGRIQSFHLDELFELRNFEVEKLLREDMFVLLNVLGFDHHPGVLKSHKSVVKGNISRAWSSSHVPFILLLELFLESKDVTLSDLSEAFLQFVNLEVLLLGKLNKESPVLSNHVDLILRLLFNRVLVHLKDAELLHHLRNLQLHVHGVFPDFVDDV